MVDLSTIEHAKALAIGHALEPGGRRFLDCPFPVRRRARKPARSPSCAAVTVPHSRRSSLWSSASALMSFHMGPLGSGQLTKTVNNVIYDINIAALAEVLPMAVAMGLDPEQLAAVVTTGTSRSFASEYFSAAHPERAVSTKAILWPRRTRTLLSCSEVSVKHGFPMPVTAAATATYQTALRQGHGGRDKGAMILPFEALLGVQVRTRPKRRDRARACTQKCSSGRRPLLGAERTCRSEAVRSAADPKRKWNRSSIYLALQSAPYRPHGWPAGIG